MGTIHPLVTIVSIHFLMFLSSSPVENNLESKKVKTEIIYWNSIITTAEMTDGQLEGLFISLDVYI